MRLQNTAEYCIVHYDKSPCTFPLLSSNEFYGKVRYCAHCFTLFSVFILY